MNYAKAADEMFTATKRMTSSEVEHLLCSTPGPVHMATQHEIRHRLDRQRVVTAVWTIILVVAALALIACIS